MHQHLFFDKPICTIDFETTGLSHANGDRAIEIGMVRLEPDGTLIKWSSLINPKTKIPRLSQSIHGIDDQMVSNAPEFTDLYPQINSLLHDAHLIAHNAEFDVGFLAHECLISQLPVPKYELVFDTLMFARHVFGLPRCNLITVSERFGIPVNNAHRALHDAYHTHLIFVNMVKALKESIQVQNTNELKELCRQSMNTKEVRANQALTIQDSINEQYCLEVYYVSGDPSRPLIQRRVVQPIHSDGYRVLVYCHLRQAERSLRLNRILQMHGPCEAS
ncbi:MAG: exonuclease domain-containing protein [Myxococcota bacterium]